jgi:hypothetical protein
MGNVNMCGFWNTKERIGNTGMSMHFESVLFLILLLLSLLFSSLLLLSFC